jgi:UDP-glucose 4-epimerase
MYQHKYSRYRVLLVTGGASFIGSHMCHNFIAKGDEVNVVDDLSAGRLAKGVMLRVGYIQ